MSVLGRLAGLFGSEVRSRGREYHRSGAVRISRRLPDGLRASVQGTRSYRVDITWPDGDFDYSCTCPFAQDYGEPCKHIWAALLDADEKGLLPGHGDAGTGDPRQPVDRAADQDEGDDLGEADGEDDDGDGDDGGEGGDDRRPLPAVLRQYVQARMSRAASHGGADPVSVGAGKGADWKRQLARLRQDMEAQGPAAPPLAWPEGRRLVYIVDTDAALEGVGLTVELATETRRGDGTWERPKPAKVPRAMIDHLPDPADRRIVQMLTGARGETTLMFGSFLDDAYLPRRFVLPEAGYVTTLQAICDTGRARVRRAALSEASDLPGPLSWDDGPPWEFWLDVGRSPGGRNYVLNGSLRRPAPAAPPAPAEPPPGEPAAPAAGGDAGQRVPLADVDLLLRGGVAFVNGTVARFEHFGAFDLVGAIRDGMKLTVPGEQGDDLLRTLFALPRLPKLDLPEELRVDEIAPPPKPRLKVRPPRNQGHNERLAAEVTFDYAGQVFEADEPAVVRYDPALRRVVRRDVRAEDPYVARLLELGFKAPGGYTESPALTLAPARLPKVVRELAGDGWHVEAEGKLYRSPGEFKLSVKSGIDWFELHGEVDFGGLSAPLPKLLAALRKGEKFVALGDGTFGLLPEEWLSKYGALAALGDAKDDHLQFSKRQVGFLDALLVSMPEARVDETFAHARDALMRFEGVEALDPPAQFKGVLRPYQREGLGWMAFLRKFGFGGCLADDMGLGKTVQVLALLEARRRLRVNGDGGGGAAGPAAVGNADPNGNGAHEPAAAAVDPDAVAVGPSLVVVPKSLVFNWMAEAAKFAPDLRVLDHTGAERVKESGGHFENYDLILTTYGTLRRDAELFKDVRFDYVVLDEAQAIKNASTGAAKAARLLRGEHRLALSGTPVQNHLGELWSLFEFLNPGMMGAASVFKMTPGTGAALDPDSRAVLARALRPFILRRTKEQVATELPEKLEQTLFCEMDDAQRRQYDELRDHYRQSLLERVMRDGINKSKIQVLEALLRLRQAACHPGLIDKARVKEPSAKIDALLEQIGQVVEEDHKVLVFSQFTSLLAIVRHRLDADGIPYEYLDGKTRDRQARVERFQTDPSCKLFLISLKAGGLGLNLTAAEYVYLLDPWWNPAVEAQAIDRAHRIGQTQRVFAYRLITKNTVEEKVLALQQTKRELADAIINADNSLIGKLGREDLEMLLS
jgi:superfamily II DNA or RNA helicase